MGVYYESGKKQSVFEGNLIECKKGKYIYSFKSDDEYKC